MSLGNHAEHNTVTELFEVVFEQNAMGMALRAVDPNNSRWLRVNQKFCDMLGYTREELLQLTSVEISLPDERHLAVRYNEQLLRGDLSSYSREKRYLRKDGTAIWTNLWLSAVLDPDGNPVQIIAVIHDITEQKKAETALQESEELFSKAFQANPVPFSISGPEGTIYDLNDAWLTTMGYTREEAIGDSSLKLGVWADPKARAQFVELLQEKGSAKGYETQYRTKSGELRDMVVSGEWVQVHGEPRLFNVSHDVTDSKAAERELKAHRDHLQELVGAATKEIKAKAVELELALAKEQELNKLQREFITMASHEFRTPLAIIDATAQRMKSQADKNRLTPEDAVQRVGKIRDAVKRMTRLMESTLTAARMQEGKIKVEIKPCDIGKVVREVCARQQEMSQAHVISCDLKDLPDTIQADAGSLEQALANLLSNAVKYAPDAPDIEIRARTQGDQVAISVRDHGLGIDADELHRIGERFFRARTSTGTAGTGIGLNLAKTLVEMHGGSLTVESTKGEGSTFTISLPIAGPDQTEQTDTQVA